MTDEIDGYFRDREAIERNNRAVRRAVFLAQAAFFFALGFALGIAWGLA